MFSLFYFGRVLGNIFALVFAFRKKTVFCTYLFMGILIFFTLMHGFFSGPYSVIFLRCVLGFATGLTPLMCLLRVELLHEEIKQKNPDANNNIEVKGIPAKFTFTVEFVGSYVVLFMAGLLYKDSWNSVFLA